jgi:valyl-tRNA synthetase
VRIRASGQEKELLKKYADYISVLGGLEQLEIGSRVKKEPEDSIAVAGDINIFVTLPEGLRNQELQRLEKKVLDIKTQSEFANKKLRNRDFIEKAPKPVVNAAKKRAEELEKEYEKLEKNLAELKQIRNK